MSEYVETHRGFVNTWECDENDHMNVQFYMKRFAEAATFHAIFRGAPESPKPLARHIRYHAELRAGEATRIRSTIVAGANPQKSLQVLHLLEGAETGKLHATALDTPPPDDTVQATGPAVPEYAAPRSLADGPSASLGAPAILARGGLVTHRRVIEPAHCDHTGSLLAHHYIGIASDGAPHAWGHAGFDSGRLGAGGFGRVAVEMKTTFGIPLKSGDATELATVSHFVGRMIHLHHELSNVRTGEIHARIDVVALIISHATRRAISIEELARLKAAS